MIIVFHSKNKSKLVLNIWLKLKMSSGINAILPLHKMHPGYLEGSPSKHQWIPSKVCRLHPKSKQFAAMTILYSFQQQEVVSYMLLRVLTRCNREVRS